LTLVGAVIVGAAGFAGTWLGEGAMYLMVAASAMGFSAVIPTTISIAQRLLPGRTGLASGLMLGTAWSVSAVAPALAQLFFGGVNLANAPELQSWRIDIAFVGFASLLIISALLTWAIPSDLLKRIGHHH
jgi:MFS family permease